MIRPVALTDAKQIAEIYNYYVLNSVATFELDPVSEKQMQQRIADTPSEYPWLVLQDNAELVGYAKLNQWKPRKAYQQTVEISVYIKHDKNGKGYGAKLYEQLLKQTKALGYHAVLAGISLPNEASERIHEKFGFEKVAHFKQTGFKFNRWVDVGYWQLNFD